MGMTVRAWIINYKFQQMSRYLDLIQGAFSQHLSEIDKAYNEDMERELEEEEYYNLEDHYTDKFFEVGRDYPNLLLSSFIITWYAFIEQQLVDICRVLQLDIDSSSKLKHEKGIRRSKKLLFEVAKYEIEPGQWQELVEIGWLRNLIVHNGNRLTGSLFKSNNKEIALVSPVGNTYYFLIEPALFKYLQRHELLEETGFFLDIFPTFNYCKHLIEFGRVLLAKLHSDFKL